MQTEGDQLVKDAETNQAAQDKATQDYVGAGTDQAEAFANDPKNASGSKSGGSGDDQSGGRFGQLANVAKAGVSFVAGNKKKFGAGGGIIGIVLAAMFSFSSLLPLKLLHIEQNLFKHNTNVQKTIEHKLASRLLRSTMSPYDAEGRYKIKGRGFFGNKWGNFNLNNFEKQLEAKGVKLNIDPQTHQLVSVERNGVVEDLSKLKQTEKLSFLSELVNEHVPPWRVGQRIKLIRLMTIRYGVSFKFWTGEKFKNMTEYLKARAKEVRNGATAAEIDAAKKARDQTNADPNKVKPTDAVKAGAAGDEVFTATQETFDRTGSMKEAIKAGASKIKGNKALGMTGIVILVCGIQEIANEAVATGYDQRAKELMRIGGNVLSSAAQNRKGDADYSTKLNFLMLQFAGDNSVKPTKIGDTTITPEDAKDFTEAADWKRAVGDPVTNASPELTSAANPDGKTGLATLMAGFNAITGVGGIGDTVCKVALSWFGTAVMAVELAANLIDGEAIEGVFTVAKLAIQVTAMTKLVPVVIAMGSGLAITGTENAVQQLAMSNAGMGLIFNDYSRAIGSKPVSDATYTKLATAAARESAIADSKKGLYFNLLDTNNAGSALSRLIDRSPGSPYQAMASLTSTFFNFQHVFGGSLLAVISPARAGLDEYANPNQFQRYGFTDEEINKYDIGDTYDKNGKVTSQGLANYFETPVVTTAAGQVAARVDIVGNPDTFQFGSEDANKNDILHCFVNSFTNPYAVGASVDPVCLDIGYLTQTDAVKPATEAQYAAGIQTNVYQVWCAANLDPKNPPPCPQAAADEMLRYRLYLAYQNTASELFDTALNDADSKAAGESLNSPYQTSTSAPAPATGPTTTGTSGKYSWPVTAAGSSLVSCYGPRNGTIHPGDDIAKPMNSPVYASQSGTVVFEGPMSGYGSNFVVIDHGGGTYTSYGHMNGATVKNGQIVTQGQQVGIIGSQGQSQGPHVHFNLYLGGKSWVDGINGNVEPLTHGLALPAGIPISGSNCGGFK